MLERPKADVSSTANVQLVLLALDVSFPRYCSSLRPLDGESVTGEYRCAISSISSPRLRSQQCIPLAPQGRPGPNGPSFGTRSCTIYGWHRTGTIGH